jgi:hypothetical protein
MVFNVDDELTINTTGDYTLNISFGLEIGALMVNKSWSNI